MNSASISAEYRDSFCCFYQRPGSKDDDLMYRVRMTARKCPSDILEESRMIFILPLLGGIKPIGLLYIKTTWRPLGHYPILSAGISICS